MRDLKNRLLEPTLNRIGDLSFHAFSNGADMVLVHSNLVSGMNEAPECTVAF
jgi:hypothetical protein